jgi:TRAP-type C4-dicarboxylate transport system substrate-binding protein
VVASLRQSSTPTTLHSNPAGFTEEIQRHLEMVAAKGEPVIAVVEQLLKEAGQENGFDATIGYKWYEVAKYYSSTDQVYEVAAYYINEKLWQSLSAQEKQVLIQAAKNGGEAMTKAGEDLEKEGIETLKKAGVTYTVPDREAFREALKDIDKPYDGKLWPAGLVDKIRAMQR